MADPEPDKRSRRPLRDRLIFRIGVGLGLGAAAILVAVVLWNGALQRERMTGLLQESAERAVETIKLSIRYAMLRNKATDVQRIIESIATQEDFERIRVFDRDGRIVMSTVKEEIATLVDRTAEQCIICHDLDPPRESVDRRFRVRGFQAPGGERMMGVTSPIRNEAACSACHEHPPERKVLGVLDVHLSREPVEAHVLASERQLGIGLAVAVACTALIAGLLVWRMVIRPVRALTHASVRARQGDLSTRVGADSRSELGTLSRAYNEMIAELEGSRRDLADWSRTLEERVEEKTSELRDAHRRMLVVEKMASLGKLAAVVAHEINNPLAGIGTYAKLLRKKLARGDDANPEADRILEMVEEESRRCGGIVRNLLLFSRDQAACYAEVDLAEVIERDIMLVRHRAELQEVELVVEVPDDLPTLSADRGQLQQLLLVLLMNGLEAMESGGTLTVTAAPIGNSGLRIEVEDTGCGIDPEEQAQVFEPFYTTKEQGAGVGLGLAVAYGIVERHGGSIRLTSAPGEGTRFTIHLPRRHPSPAGAAHAGATGETP